MSRERDVVFIKNIFPANLKDFSKNETQRETEVVQILLDGTTFQQNNGHKQENENNNEDNVIDVDSEEESDTTSSSYESIKSTDTNFFLNEKIMTFTIKSQLVKS